MPYYALNLKRFMFNFTHRHKHTFPINSSPLKIHATHHATHHTTDHVTHHATHHVTHHATNQTQEVKPMFIYRWARSARDV